MAVWCHCTDIDLIAGNSEGQGGMGISEGWARPGRRRGSQVAHFLRWEWRCGATVHIYTSSPATAKARAAWASLKAGPGLDAAGAARSRTSSGGNGGVVPLYIYTRHKRAALSFKAGALLATTAG